MTALKHLNANNSSMNSSLERLSSGFRINNAADDASGFAVSSKLSAQTERLKAASLNATQAQAMTKMADAGVNEIQNMIVRIQTLATQASSANNAGELGKLDSERIKLESAINKIANGTNYNGVNLLNGQDASTFVQGTAATAAVLSVAAANGVNGIAISGTATYAETATFTVKQNADGTINSITADTNLTDATTGALLATAGDELLATPQTAVGASTTVGGLTFTSAASLDGLATAGTQTSAASVAGTATGVTAYTAALSFQVGAENTANNQVAVDLTKSYTTASLGLGGSDLLTQANAQAYIDTAKTALNTLITQRADLGATQNQVAFLQANLATSIEQTTASVSAIRDADMAEEMAAFTKNQILTQASTSMLAQANQTTQNVMTLFR